MYFQIKGGKVFHTPPLAATAALQRLDGLTIGLTQPTNSRSE